jgi:hypothetical protein
MSKTQQDFTAPLNVEILRELRETLTQLNGMRKSCMKFDPVIEAAVQAVAVAITLHCAPPGNPASNL